MAQLETSTIWHLRAGHDRRLRSGHPWVFSNELSASPKGHEPGAPVELRDHQNRFLAYGYGNPHSLIAFRAWSFASHEVNAGSGEFIVERLLQAWRRRHQLGYRRSFRLCFSEGDFLPGLILDRYVLEKPRRQVLVAQMLTAGVDRVCKRNPELWAELFRRAQAEGLSDFSPADSWLVIRNDASIRKLEGLEIEDSQAWAGNEILREEVLLQQAPVCIQDPSGGDDFIFTTDLWEGQKTGFFLDQSYNIDLVVQQIRRGWKGSQGPVRILDLCSYVGQWSMQLSRALRASGQDVEVSLVDVSKEALERASQNLAREGIKTESLKMDVLEGLGALAERTYDIVVADPPAFIKAKKDLPTGQHAYLKLNTQAFRLVREGGLVISCSCSGLLSEEDFTAALSKALHRNQRKAVVIGQGGHAPDHPRLYSFPEGFYLKMRLHLMS